MRKYLVILFVISLMRVSVAYADSGTPITIQNFFLGTKISSNNNLNQVLALLIGPKGDAGPAGVAGRDGFVGMNGKDGVNGLPGAPGEVGPQGPAGPQGPQGPAGPQGPQGPAGQNGTSGISGTSVLVISIPTGSSECSGNGGSKFVANGVTTYACNGTTGSGSGYVFGFGQGTVNLSSCDADATVGFRFPTTFDGEDFYLRSITITDVDGQCLGATLKVFLKVKSSGTLSLSSPEYALGDLVTCTLTLSAANSSVAINPAASLINSFTIANSSICQRENSAGSSRPSILLGHLGTRDLSGVVGFEIS